MSGLELNGTGPSPIYVFGISGGNFCSIKSFWHDAAVIRRDDGYDRCATRAHIRDFTVVIFYYLCYKFQVVLDESLRKSQPTRSSFSYLTILVETSKCELP